MTDNLVNPSGSNRRLQTTEIDPASLVYGTVYFYMDGRIKEVLPNGAIYWNLKYYDVNQNPNADGSMNSSFHLRVKYNSEDGSFTEYWKDEDAVAHATTDDNFKTWS